MKDLEGGIPFETRAITKYHGIEKSDTWSPKGCHSEPPSADVCLDPAIGRYQKVKETNVAEISREGINDFML
jgi:hypothetical protein